MAKIGLFECVQSWHHKVNQLEYGVPFLKVGKNTNIHKKLR